MQTGQKVIITKDRINKIIDEFGKNFTVCVSGGKDSSAMLQLVLTVAKERGCRGWRVMHADIEAAFKSTIDHLLELEQMTRPYAYWDWYALPIRLENGLSQIDPFWYCWQYGVDWVRQPPRFAITQADWWTGGGMMDFLNAYNKETGGAILIGIRSEESLNRWRAANSSRVNRYKDLDYTVDKKDWVQVYPMHDWTFDDIFDYLAVRKYNSVYDKMYWLGLSYKDMRICQPYGYCQRNTVKIMPKIEPDTWQKVVERVSGANLGQYLDTEYFDCTLPKGMQDYKDYYEYLIRSLPKDVADNYVSHHKGDHKATVRAILLNNYICDSLATKKRSISNTTKTLKELL